jgi:hypothetical protein
MPDPRKEIALQLTTQQQSFVREIVAGRRPDDAARAAGYTGDLWSKTRTLLHQTSVATAIRLEINRLLIVEAAPLAYRVLVELASDKAVPSAIRRAAARDLLDRSGFIPPKASSPDSGPEKPLSDMSSDELRGLVDRLESELGARAVPVEPPSPGDNAQHIGPPSDKPLSWLD